MLGAEPTLGEVGENVPVGYAPGAFVVSPRFTAGSVMRSFVRLSPDAVGANGVGCEANGVGSTSDLKRSFTVVPDGVVGFSRFKVPAPKTPPKRDEPAVFGGGKEVDTPGVVGVVPGAVGVAGGVPDVAPLPEGAPGGFDTSFPSHVLVILHTFGPVQVPVRGSLHPGGVSEHGFPRKHCNLSSTPG